MTLLCERKSYRCIRDCPIAYTLSGDFLVNTSNYSMDPMRLVQKSFRPDNPKYQQLFLRSTDDITECKMETIYPVKCVQKVEKFINV